MPTEFQTQLAIHDFLAGKSQKKSPESPEIGIQFLSFFHKIMHSSPFKIRNCARGRDLPLEQNNTVSFRTRNLDAIRVKNRKKNDDGGSRANLTVRIRGFPNPKNRLKIAENRPKSLETPDSICDFFSRF